MINVLKLLNFQPDKAELFLFPPHPLQTEVLCSCSMMLRYGGQGGSEMTWGSLRSALCCCSSDKNINHELQPEGWKQLSEGTPGSLPHCGFFTTGGGRRLLSTTFFLPPFPLHQWDKTLTSEQPRGASELFIPTDLFILANYQDCLNDSWQGEAIEMIVVIDE